MDLVLDAYASCSSSDDDDEEDDSVDHARQAVERLLRGTLFGLDEVRNMFPFHLSLLELWLRVTAQSCLCLFM